MAKKKTNLQKKQDKLKRQYAQYFEKLSVYGQEPSATLKHNPWTSDVERLKNRYGTVKKYADYYYRLNQDIEEFNQKYKQNIPTYAPTSRITKASYEALKKFGKKQKMKMRRIEQSIQNEADLIEKNIKGLLQTAYNYSQPTHYTSAGETTAHQEIVQRHINKFNEFYSSVVPSDANGKYNALKRIKKNWEAFTKALDQFIYDSDGDKVLEAWQTIVFLFTGDSSAYNEIDYTIDEETGIE